MSRTIIVGAGQAGFAVATRLRNKGYDGEIALIGEEADPPYQRPPLSKKYLTGDMSRDRLYFRPPGFYADNKIELRTATNVEAIDRQDRSVRVGGTRIPYEVLVLATGARPRRLPKSMGGELTNVYYMRTLADIDLLAPEFRPGAKLLIVGGGYIGLETAAVAASLGLMTTLIEASPRILQRVASRETAAFLRQIHRQRGVQVIEGTGLKRLVGNGRAAAAETDDDRRLNTDFVVVGIGVVPETRLAAAAGLTVDNGIQVDAQGRTSDRSIFAAGDCASFPHRGEYLRLESVPHAIDQGNAVAEAIMGSSTPYTARPWFWSDQYDLKLQIAGLNTGYDRVIERAGTRPGTASFWYFRGRQLLAVDAANDAQAYVMGKRWIEAGQSPEVGDLADQSKPLKEIAAS
ncbi:FAD/NAD(P)-binding oxidoreductase [Bradyrhizobium sp. 1]|uniref:NAD(P)/FAD-dependent oxidoreductase n=1 Tax=Bradyrhizobium sp. 1 TaxID=241591 RepID=UPI001FFA6FF4|nr:FAD/NAD(P)-binding oxidoreductase [Bradyrhizobium sp. 1]MCK1394397.1 oxidoreductase [Bradyrhizobium sp. 1]